MSSSRQDWTRRDLLAGLAAAGIGLSGLPAVVRSAEPETLTKPIPSTGERLPVIGMGTWITFNVGENAKARAVRVEVMRNFFAAGGGMVDSSPMYGSAEAVIGHCLARLQNDQALFSASKVWTLMQSLGIDQMERSERLWDERPFDLFQIHNLLNWKSHLETLREWKAKERVRYIGVTTSHGRRHGDLADIMERQPIDFVQFTYNILDREAETRLLPLAADKGLAVIINRPFRRGGLIDMLEGNPLPAWAGEIGCTAWSQFLLKFIVSHPAVTCVIPATSRVDHMRENMVALRGPLPDAAMRARMIDYVEKL